jgi:hypothetical protein
VTRLQAVRKKDRRSIRVKRLLSTAFRTLPGTSNYDFVQCWEIFSGDKFHKVRRGKRNSRSPPLLPL